MENIEITKRSHALDKDTRDIVFLEGFASDENLPKIYHSLYPEDNNWCEHEYLKINTKTTLENEFINDLSFAVRGKQAPDRLICLEVQPNWEIKNLTRFAEFALSSNVDAYTQLQDYDFFKTQVDIYVFIAGQDGNSNLTYNFSEDDDSIKYKFFLRIISKKNKNVPDTHVFHQYLEFFDLYVKTISKFGKTRRALDILSKKCIELKIYPEIFEDKKRREQFVSDYLLMFSNQAIFNTKERDETIEIKTDSSSNN